MYSTKSATICLALILALLEVGSCLQCFHCNSLNDANCRKTFTSNDKSMDCASKGSFNYNQENLYGILPPEVFGGVVGAPRYCYKIVLETGTVVRTCLDGNPSNKEQTCKFMIDESKTSTPDRKIKSCVVCDKDNCN